MSDKFSISRFVPELLKAHPEHRFTAREIALWIMKTYPSATQNKRSASTARKISLDSDEAMAQQIVAEIGAQRPALEARFQVRTTEERPRKYYFSIKSLEDEANSTSLPIQAITADPKTPEAPATGRRESDLYPVFCEYLWNEFSLFSLRIDEKRSMNNRGQNGNRWLFPDIVALEDLSSGCRAIAFDLRVS